MHPRPQALTGALSDRVLAVAAEAGRRADSCLVLDANRGAVDGAILLLLRRGQLVAVGKLGLSEVSREIYGTEVETLRALVAAGLNRVWPRVPEILAELPSPGALITLQTPVPGQPLRTIPAARLFAPGAMERTFADVLDWWHAFQECSPAVRVTLDDPAYRRLVLEPLDLLCRSCRLRPDLERFLRQRLEEGGRLRGADLPLMATHGDFCPANMSYGPGGICVFDWEYSLDRKLPLFDLFFFFSSTRYPFANRRGESDHLSSFRQVFWGNGALPRAARRHLRHAAAASGIAGGHLPDLFLLALIESANRKVAAVVENARVERAAWESAWSSRALHDLVGVDVPLGGFRGGEPEALRTLFEQGDPVFH